MAKLGGKVAIITGATSGIGAATALAFAKDGAKLTITGRREKRLGEVAKECRKFEGCEVLEIVSDLTIFENLKPIIDKTVEKFDRIDILVNNAGIGGFCKIADYEVNDYQTLLDGNLRAPVFLSKFSLPHLMKTKGCVINVSSCLSMTTMPTLVPYSMTKVALDHFTRGFAAECASSGVRVNAINPGVTATDFFTRLGTSEETYVGLQPMGMIQSENIAEAIMFIVCSSHMTGSCVLLDAGCNLPTS